MNFWLEVLHWVWHIMPTRVLASFGVIRISSLGINDETTTEIDNHADQCVVGIEALVFHDFEVPVRVTRYDKTQVMTYKTVSAALAYNDPQGRQPVILSIHQAILVLQMKHHLLCLMKL